MGELPPARPNSQWQIARMSAHYSCNTSYHKVGGFLQQGGGEVGPEYTAQGTLARADGCKIR